METLRTPHERLRTCRASPSSPTTPTFPTARAARFASITSTPGRATGPSCFACTGSRPGAAFHGKNPQAIEKQEFMVHKFDITRTVIGSNRRGDPRGRPRRSTSDFGGLPRECGAFSTRPKGAPGRAGWPRAVARPRLPQIRTCPIRASGSSGYGVAARTALCTMRGRGSGQRRQRRRNRCQANPTRERRQSHLYHVARTHQYNRARAR